MANSIYLILLTLALTPSAYSSADFRIYQPGQLKISRPNTKQILQQPTSGDACRDRISHAMCLTDQRGSTPNHKKCLEGSEAYAAPVERVYDILPAKLQKAFCGIDAIFVEDGMESLAYAGAQRHNDESGNITAYMGIRKVLLEQNYDATSVFGWKEQRAFGLVAPPFIHLPAGPRVEVVLPHSLSALQYVIIHELGHVLDFANYANEFKFPDYSHCEDDECRYDAYRKAVPVEGSWSELSWKSPTVPRSEHKFPLWDNLCFYNCHKSLNVNDIEDFYSQLEKTNFISTYAAVSPYEDFAESLTFFILSSADFSYNIKTPLKEYALEQRWQTLHDKKAWLESFYNQDLKYPIPLK